MKELTIELGLFLSKPLDRARITRLVEIVLENRFVVLRNVNKRMRRVDSKQEVPDLLESHLIKPKPDHPDATKKWSIVFPAYPENPAGFENASIEIRQFKPGVSMILVSGLLDFEFADQREYVASFAEALKALARSWYPVAAPDLIIIDKDAGDKIDVEDVSREKLSNLGWVNMWSPAYVERHGRELLRDIPGYKAASLDDGGVYYQISETFSVPSDRQAKPVRQAAIEHFAKRDIKVACRAPYVIK